MPVSDDLPIVIEGAEQENIDAARADGGLSPAVGVRSYQVFRASNAMLTDQKGWTYHHHVDMACWKGRLYVGWNSCEKDEDTWPSRELLSWSNDGVSWSDPIEMFPQGTSTPLRMYFFHALNGRMLVIAGMRVDTADTNEDTKGGLVVRELRTDHTLGEVFALREVARKGSDPFFRESTDAGFVEACEALLADNVYLEQQDRGRLLGERHMKWHDPSAWPEGKVPGNNEKWVFGKGFSFYRRAGGEWVGLSKLRFVTTSTDNGMTWTKPVQPPTLITGAAKVWGQRTRDGRYALVYNPSTSNRFPLVVVLSDDGKHFRDMRLVQGELPRQRYVGKFRSVGPQYVRGISTWADDGSRPGDDCMWLVYSMSKEDIWVSRVPLPIQPGGDGWNVYSPKWSPVTMHDETMRLEDRDPYDYASATRCFAPSANTTLSFELSAEQTGAALHVEVVDSDGTKHHVITPQSRNEWKTHTLKVQSLERVTFRTKGARKPVGTDPIDPSTDRPQEPVVFHLRTVTQIR